MLHGDRAALTLDEKGARSVPYEMERSRGYACSRIAVEPRLLPRRSGARPRASRWSRRPSRGRAIRGADAGGRGERARCDAGAGLLAIAGPAPTRIRSAAELVLAADQFIITPAGRAEEAARARAAGEEVRTVIAGYHWFTDWGRDTMISLEGLTLTTGRYREAGYILRTFAHYVRDGLIPNMFPDGASEGLYHTADATLWFFHAVERYVDVTGDAETAAAADARSSPTSSRIISRARASASASIRPTGCCARAQQGYQLTWMDAKVDDWVVTPRRGKAVEINALWYNALRLLDGWTQRVRRRSRRSRSGGHAPTARASRSTGASGSTRADISTTSSTARAGDDSACRPNQVFAISLDHPVLDRARWEPVMKVVRERLLTPVGLRSLAPGHPDYKAKYYGDLRSRDAAYHQGTVWAWLIGPFVDAWLKLHPERPRGRAAPARRLRQHLDEACVGSISEIFDAEAAVHCRAAASPRPGASPKCCAAWKNGALEARLPLQVRGCEPRRSARADVRLA